MFLWAPFCHGRKRWRAKAKMMDASLMVGEMVENVMGERTCGSLPETIMERKSYSLGNRKWGPLSDPVFQSILNQERLIEDSLRRVCFEEDKQKKKKGGQECELPEGKQTRRVGDTCSFVACLILTFLESTLRTEKVLNLKMTEFFEF